MLAGAVLVTDYTTYLNGRFDDEDMVIFRLDELSGLPEKIKAVLSDEDLRERIALSGQKKTLAGHTWDKRAEEFIDKLNT
jgi:spore maturation protein CgeB